MAAGGNDIFTKIMLKMDGSNGGTTFTDIAAGGSAHTWTPTNATTSTASAKFGEAGLFAAGQLTTPDHADFALADGAWAIDFWANRNGNNGLRSLFGQGDSTAAGNSILGIFTAGNVFNVQVSDGTSNISASTTTAITDSNWHHFAIVRDGSLLRIFSDGAQEATTAFTGFIPDSADAWFIGANGTVGSTKYSGYLDEFRLSVGIARWTGTFTPPTEAYQTEAVLAAAGVGALSGTGRWTAAAALAAAGVGAFTPDPTGSGINSTVLSATGTGTFLGIGIPPADVIGTCAAYSVEGRARAYSVEGSVEIP